MRVTHASSKTERLEREPAYTDGRPPDVVKAFRKRMQFLRAAKTEQDLRNWKALHFEKLKGQRKDERSVRLNDQWRLILKLEQATNGPQIVVVGITDYH
ncbi:MAG: type II toxin-antitoxin system RelE/ParE family toxin [Candidatus Sulfotelmatobacter sp.]